MVSPFFCPAELTLRNRGSGRGEEPSGAKVFRLIQIRLAAVSFEKSRQLVNIIYGSQIGVPKNASQLFIRTHNETLSVIAGRIPNQDRSPVRIND